MDPMILLLLGAGAVVAMGGKKGQKTTARIRVTGDCDTVALEPDGPTFLRQVIQPAARKLQSSDPTIGADKLAAETFALAPLAFQTKESKILGDVCTIPTQPSGIYDGPPVQPAIQEAFDYIHTAVAHALERFHDTGKPLEVLPPQES